MISAIVAQAHGRVIGKQNDLPWYLPADLKHFKDVTNGHTVIMGRKTFDSIVARIGRPLPNRRNIVITRDTDFSAESAEVAHSIQEALELAQDDEVFIIGGAQIYEQALPHIHRIYLTQVEVDIDGDAFFPELSDDEWREVSHEEHDADDRNPYKYSFLTLDRHTSAPSEQS